MKIYHADPLTGEYTGSSDARPDPMVPGRYLVPAHAYEDNPGIPPQGKVWVREGSTWVAKPPPIPPAPRARSLTFRQLVIGLTREGWISIAEGRGWMSRNALPSSAVALIEATYPDDGQARFEAEADMLGITQADRNHPLVSALAQQAGKTEAEVNAFFAAYAGV